MRLSGPAWRSCLIIGSPDAIVRALIAFDSLFVSVSLTLLIYFGAV